MIRTKQNKKPDAILCSDMHLRETQPVCRTDDYCNVTQWRKLDFIDNLQKKYNCPVLHAGDLYDFWKPSPQLISQTIEYLPDQFYTVYGQHDEPQHNLELVYKSGVYTLAKARKLTVLPGMHWGQTTPFYNKSTIKINGRYILIQHIHVYQGKQPWPGCTSPEAKSFIKKFNNLELDLILTGDNHIPFVEEYEGRLLVNPGSMGRQDADQINHKPRVYLWYAETNTVEPVYIPIEDNVISREHIDVKKQRDERIEAFVSRLDHEWDASLDFEKNLNEFERSNDVNPKVMEIVCKSLEPTKK